MASAIEHYRAAETCLAQAKAAFGDEEARANLLAYADIHCKLASIGIAALNDADEGKSRSEIVAWMQEVGHNGGGNSPVAMRKAAA